ncbi:MAG: GNAT family N-acetyltransferase [Enterococcus sp.]
MADEVEVVIRQAVPEDAAELLALTKQIGSETEFLVMDETGMALPEELLAQQLASFQESPNNLLLVAQVDQQLVGLASVTAAKEWRIAHIGEVGISILRAYWGIGLGSIMMEEVLEWAKQNERLYRLELTVQVRNQRGIALYERFGFVKEATLSRGARSDAGQFIDVYLMSYLLELTDMS